MAGQNEWATEKREQHAALGNATGFHAGLHTGPKGNIYINFLPSRQIYHFVYRYIYGYCRAVFNSIDSICTTAVTSRYRGDRFTIL